MDLKYVNGTILTMDNGKTADAVWTHDGLIRAVGTREEIDALAPDAKEIDLEHRVMLPAFIDPHSHLSSYAASLLQVALDGCSSGEEIGQRIAAFRQANHVADGEWILAKGYDHNLLPGARHPSLAQIDSWAPENPLAIQHASGHFGLFNSRALAAFGITVQTPSPEGGRILQSGGKLTGGLEENAFFTYMKKTPLPGMEALVQAYQQAQRNYASYGITSVQEGYAVGQMVPLYQGLLAAKALFLDVTAYAAPADADAWFTAFPASIKQYDRHLRLGGYKIFLDGSPQGRTAWMRTPYCNPDNAETASADSGSTGADSGYCGYGTMQDEEVLQAIRMASAHQMQILAHCNGDAAAKQYLDCLQKVNETTPVSALRPVMIHAQLVGIDQLPQLAALSVIPSFFVAHVYHWGDIHIRNFGPDRAAQISPAASAARLGLPFTFHQDTPVIAPDMMETVWCAVNRLTGSGVLLGAQERITPQMALEAITSHAAYQYFDEAGKGTITAGKVADFVILDQNPLTVPPQELRNIRVCRTIRRDEVIYERP